MEKNKFVDTFSDDLLCIEEAYKNYIKKHPEADWLIWQSLCRVYTMIAIASVDFFIENVLIKMNQKFQGTGIKDKIELIVKTALKTKIIPQELDIPEKIQKYVYLRELRHYIAHTNKNLDREIKVKLINLDLEVDKFSEKEFNIIKEIIENITNLLGMSMCLDTLNKNKEENNEKV